MLYPRFILISLVTCSSLVHASNKEQDPLSPPFALPNFKPSQMDFGGVGLMQMPTGRMAKEGEFNFGYSQNNNYDFYSLSIQLMPWFESTLRYTKVQDALYSNSSDFSGNTKYADKGIDVKLKLLKESQYLPETSLGLRDIGGTGLFDGEFIAATKRVSTDRFGQFDFTLGLGWGYLGQRSNIENPLCSASERFCNRSNNTGNGGKVDYNHFFHGPSSIFGGIEYQTPYEPLKLKLEYDGNDYSQDFAAIRGNTDLSPSTPWNFGVVYALNNSTNLKLSYERGNTLTLGFNLYTNFNDQKATWKDAPIPPHSNNQPDNLKDVDWNKVDNDLSTIAGYEHSEIYQNGDKITVLANQAKYRDRNIAHERAAAVLANELPTKITTYDLIEKDQRIALTGTQIDANKYNAVANVSYVNANIKDATQPVDIDNIVLKSPPLYNGQDALDYGITPHLDQSFGNPESFYIYSLGLNGNASYWLNSHVQLSSSIQINLLDNYDQLNYTKPSDGTNNYRVRTLVRAYVHDNNAYISNLQLTWFEKYGSNWYQQFYAGYLETMYAGVGSEMLYRQPNSNWAIGADLNLVSQRDPSSQFGIFDDTDGYGQDTKVLVRKPTGHISIYYQPQWKLLKNTLFRLDVGRFLAQDDGVQLDFSKQFDTGVIVGAYASKTNMSAEQYGEGSFTKGFYMSIPFDIISVKPTTRRAGLSWQPLSRDGGQKLSKRNNLFDITDAVAPWYGRPNNVD